VALFLTDFSRTTTFQIKTTFALPQKLSLTNSGKGPLHEFKIEQAARGEYFLPTLSPDIYLAVR
jgi:hypothetical protein